MLGKGKVGFFSFDKSTSLTFFVLRPLNETLRFITSGSSFLCFFFKNVCMQPSVYHEMTANRARVHLETARMGVPLCLVTITVLSKENVFSFSEFVFFRTCFVRELDVTPTVWLQLHQLESLVAFCCR